VKELATIVGRLEAAGAAPRVLATLVAVEGSSYRRAGARALFEADGSRLGSISGGCLEEDIQVRARAVAASGRAELATYDTTSENDLVWGTGAGCHGVVRVLLERLPERPAWALRLAENLRAGRPTELAVVWRAEGGGALGTALAGEMAADGAAAVFRQTVAPPPALALFGAGDDAQPLARGAAELGWRVTVADPRPAFATAARFPGAALVVAPAAELVARVGPPADGLAVVMTHHYVHDVPVLRELLARPLAYLGLLGPRQRADRILADLAAGGLPVTPAMRARLHAPVGLDLGADGPEEVALSILAEIRAALSGRDGRPLRQRTRPIHG
jgi:xanthine dehydrogenase accessory factor